MSRLKLPFVPAADRDTFTGTDREITFDPVNTKLVIHDGFTPGGFPLLTEEDKTNTTKAELTKTFASGESASLTLSEEVTTAPVVSVTKEVPQTGVTSNDWDVASDGSNYTLHDTAYSTTLTPSDAGADGIFTLGAGSFAAEDVGKRIEGNGGVAFLTATDGSYAIDTPFNDTSTISDWSMFALDVESAAAGLALSSVLLSGYDLDNASYSSVSLSTDPPEGSAGGRGIAFNTDGTKMIFVGTGSDSVFEYTLSTPFDLSTASYTSTSFSVSSQDTNPNDVSFNTDGTKMYIAGTGSASIYEYDVATAFDISTASYNSVSLDVSSQEGGPAAVVFSNDGSKLYIVGANSDSIHEYALSSPFDLSTGTFNSISFNVSSEDDIPQALSFNNDGTKLFMSGLRNDQVHQYSLSSAFDLSTISYDSVSFDVSSESTSPSGLSFNSDGSKMYIVGGSNIYQYNTASFALPTSANHTAITSASTNTEFWVDINSMTADDASNDGSVYYAVSTDDRTTWKIIDDAEGAERAIVRNNAGTWEYNDASDYGTETWVAASENDEFYALEEAVDLSTAQATTAYDLENASYTGDSKNISAVAGAVRGIFFKNDGSRMFVSNDFPSPESVYQFDLSTAWDITSATYSNISLNISSEEDRPGEIFIKPDGSHLYLLGSTNRLVHDYSLSTPWDLSTASYTGASFDVSSQELSPFGLFFKNDGTSFYITGFGVTPLIYQYDMTTAWDITTASFSGKSIDAGSEAGATQLQGLSFSNDGSLLYLLDNETQSAIEITLSTPWDLATASFTGVSLDLSNEARTAYGGIFVDQQGFRLFVSDNDEIVFKYSVSSSDSTNRMDAAQLNAVSDSNHYTLGDDLDLAITLTMPDSGSTSPTSDGVSINYDATAKNSGAILGTDYEWDRPAADAVKFKALSNENFKIRVV